MNCTWSFPEHFITSHNTYQVFASTEQWKKWRKKLWYTDRLCLNVCNEVVSKLEKQTKIFLSFDVAVKLYVYSFLNVQCAINFSFSWIILFHCGDTASIQSYFICGRWLTATLSLTVPGYVFFRGNRQPINVNEIVFPVLNRHSPQSTPTTTGLWVDR